MAHYLIKRGDTFYFNHRIRTVIFRLSLKTPCRNVATERALILHILTMRLIKMNLTEDEIKRQACIAAEELYREWEDDIHGANLSISNYNSMLEENHIIRSELQEALARRQLTGESMLNAYTDLRLIQLKNKAIESRTTPEKMFEEFDQQHIAAPVILEKKPLSIKKEMEKFLDEKLVKNPSTNSGTIIGYRVAVDFFIEITHVDDAHEVTHDIAKEFRNILLKVPKNRNKGAYKDRSIDEILATGVPEELRPSNKTVNQKVQKLRSLFETLVTQGEVSINPFKGLELTEEANSYAGYTDGDLKTIFSAPLLSKSTAKQSHWWLLALATYTGARLGELTQLSIQDVHTSESIHYLNITDEGEDGENRTLKTKAAKRQIPIHDDLISLGFIDYINQLKAAGVTRVLPQIRIPEKQTDSAKKQLNPSHYASRWYNEKFKASLQFEPSQGRKTFHSFRHTFINRALKCDFDKSKLQQMVGHEPSLLGETATYQGDGYSLAQLKAEMDKFSYEGFSYRDIARSWKYLMK